MAAVEVAPWARGRTAAEFREFLAELPGVTLVDGLYVSDRAPRRAAQPGSPHAPESTSDEPAPDTAPRLPPSLRTVADAAGLTMVDGPVSASAEAVRSVKFWIFLDPRPFIGGRYLVTQIGSEASITPDLIAEVIRLTEDNYADRCILVGLRSISAAADAYARGRPVHLVPGAEAVRVGKELRGE